jgi:tripartite-type tricarboxylate transporter receptor subunit TctC
MNKNHPRQATRRAMLNSLGLCAAITLALAGWAPAQAQAQAQAQAPAVAYPDKPVRLVVPYPPGGATDVIGRVLAQQLSDKLGQQFIVDNRAGAGGSLGAGQVGKAAADGYTLLMGAFTSHSINAALLPKTVPYDIEKSFSMVSIVGTVPLVFVVNPAVKANTLGELIALAKASPGALAFASAGNGSPQHLAAEMFKRMAGVDVLHVPYKGSGPAMTDLMGGQVQAMIETAPAAQSHVKSGKLRALATTTTEPVASLPGVPTASASGLPGFTVSSMFGIAAPAGTPADIVNKLNAALKEILARTEVRDSLLAQGAIAQHTSPQDATKAIAVEYAKWAKVIKDGNIVVE